MRTQFTVEDTKNLIDEIFNGNLGAFKATKGKIPYNNPNSEEIVFIDEETGEQKSGDLAQYLNVKYYAWKERLIENEDYDRDQSQPKFLDLESWLKSKNHSMNEAYGLVEKIDEEVTASQDIDSATIRGKVSFIVQTDKIKNLDYYITKVRNAYLGVPQQIQNSYGNMINAYIMIGALMYDSEPEMTQLGECILCSFNFSISYLNEALNYSNTKIEMSLDNGLTYDSMPIVKMTNQLSFNEIAVPYQNRVDLAGFNATAITSVANITFYDFNLTLSNKFNNLFWSLNAISIDGEETSLRDVNVPVYLRTTSNGHTYIYRCVITGMEKVIQNGDFNVSSITLKGWGKTPLITSDINTTIIS